MASLTPKPVTPKVVEVSKTLDPATVAGNALSGALGFLDNITSAAETVLQTYVNRFDQGMTGFLQNIVETSRGSVEGLISSLTLPTVVPKDVKDRAKGLIQEGKSGQAAALIDPYAEKYTVSELTVIFDRLDTTLTSQTTVATDNTVFPTPYEIGQHGVDWSGAANPDYVFPYINSYEELLAEIKSIDREVTTLVVHWTDTFSNKHLTAEDIHKTHIALDMDGIGYHYIIRRDGTLQRGRPVDLIGDHTAAFNNLTLSIAFVGGYTCPTNTNSPETFKSRESLTRAQFNTFDQFCNVFYAYIPGGQLVGHNDLEEVDDPGFDVVKYARNRFNKPGLYSGTDRKRVFTRAEINAAGQTGQPGLDY